MLPKNMTPTHNPSAVTASTFEYTGAVCPSRIHVGSKVNSSVFRPAAIRKASFQLNEGFPTYW